MMTRLVKHWFFKNFIFYHFLKSVLCLGQSDIILGHVYRISINGVLYYPEGVMSDESNNIGMVEDNSKKISHIKIYTSSPLKDSFSTNIGNVWNMIINGVVIKGNLTSN